MRSVDVKPWMRTTVVALVVAFACGALAMEADATVRVASELWLGSPGGTVDFLDLSEDGEDLLVGTVEGTVQIWQRDGARWIRRFSFETCSLQDVTWLAGPEIVLVQSEDGAVVGLDSAGAERYILPTPGGALADDPVASLTASADGRHLATVGQSGTLALWDGQDGRLRAIHEGTYCPEVAPLVSHDGGAIVLPARGDDNPYCGFLEARHASGESIGPLPLATRPAYLDATGRLLITRYDPDRGIRPTIVWDTRDGRSLFFGRIEPNLLAAFVLAASPDPDDARQISAMFWGASSPLTGPEDEHHCASTPLGRPGGRPVLVRKGARGLEFCDPLDGSTTHFDLGSQDTPMDMTLDGRFVAVGTVSGHVVVVELEGDGDMFTEGELP